jgi:hypothetical protein
VDLGSVVDRVQSVSPTTVVAAMGAMVVGLVVVNMIGRRVSQVMERWLGDWYDYAAIFYVLILCVLAALAVLYFVVPLWIWLGLVLLVLVSAIALAELA